jgi:hypothetical protein
LAILQKILDRNSIGTFGSPRLIEIQSAKKTGRKNSPINQILLSKIEKSGRVCPRKMKQGTLPIGIVGDKKNFQ